jgi:hypothetical protein
VLGGLVAISGATLSGNAAAFDGAGIDLSTGVSQYLASLLVGRRAVPEQAVPERVQFDRTSPDADEGIIPALVAIRELLAENGGAMQRLVNVADQVKQSREADRLFLDGLGRDPRGAKLRLPSRLLRPHVSHDRIHRPNQPGAMGLIRTRSC